MARTGTIPLWIWECTLVTNTERTVKAERDGNVQTGFTLTGRAEGGGRGLSFVASFFALLLFFFLLFFFSCPLKQSRRNGSLFLPSLYFCL